MLGTSLKSVLWRSGEEVVVVSLFDNLEPWTIGFYHETSRLAKSTRSCGSTY